MSFTSYTPPGGGADGWFDGEVVLASDFTTNSTAFTNVTGMNFSLEADSSYLIEVFISFQSNTAGNGIGITTTLPLGAQEDLTMREMQSTTDTSLIFESGDGSSDTTPTISTAVAAANTSYFARVTCIVKTSVFSGTFQLRVRSENGAGQSVSIKAGTYARMRKVA